MGMVGVVADDAPTPIPPSVVVEVDVRAKFALAAEESIAGTDALLAEAVNEDVDG
jgi:hypothetical protein